MSTQAIPTSTVEQYLEVERKAEFRSEYLNGQVYAMSGGTLDHARIVRNALAQFSARLRGSRCEAVGADLRLFCSRYNVFTYPDVLVTCGLHRFLDDRLDTITDAALIVDAHRRERFRYYRSLESFSEYLLLAQDTIRAEHHVRQPDGSWLFREFTSPANEIQLNSIGCRLNLESLYERVEFEAST